jgi:hypothetical protein
MAVYVNTIYHLIVISMVLGGFFSRTTLTTPASVVRELCIWLLVVLLLGTGLVARKSVSGLLRPALYVLFASFSIGLLTTGIYDLDVRTISNKWAVLYKFFQFFVLVACFSGYSRLTGRPLESLAKNFVVYLAIYALVSPVIYFYPPSIMIENFRWWGRFGVGYPTMDSQLYALGIVLLLFGKVFNGFPRALLLALCLWGVLIQVTATGFVTVAAVFAVYALLHFRAALKSVPAVVLVSVAGAIVLSLAGSDVTGAAVDLFWVKVQNLTGANSDINTLDIRQDQFNDLLYMLRGDFLANWIGVGVGIYVENQYGFSRIAFGILGVAAYIGVLGLIFAEGFKRRKLDGGVLFASGLVLALTSYTLTVFYLYPLTCALAMALLYSEGMKRQALASVP